MSKSSLTISSFPVRQARTRRFTLGAPRSPKISADGRRILFARSSHGEDPVNDLWLLADGGTEQCIVDAQQILAQEVGELSDAEKVRRERAREQADGIVTFAATSNLEHAAFVLGGELWTVDTSTGELSSWASAASPYDPRFDPVTHRLAYVCGNALHVTDATTDRVVASPTDDETTDDETSVSWGSADFIAAEEMGRSRGFWWSPDGSKLAACRTDTTAVSPWWISAPISPGEEPRQIKYPAAGTNNPDVELWIVDAELGPVRSVEWRTGGYEYLADVIWDEELLLVVQPRDQRSVTVLQVDIDTGATREVLSWSDEYWVELHPGTPAVTDLGMIMVVDTATHRTIAIDDRLLDFGDLQVRSFLGVVGAPLACLVTTDGTDSLRCLVDPVHGEVEQLDPAGIFVTASMKNGTWWTAEADGGSTAAVRVVWANGSSTVVQSHRAEFGFEVRPQFFEVGARQLNVALCLPSGHDGSPLPVLMDPYGGPHAQRVLRSQSAFASSQWFAEQGYAVVVVDGRGTPGRGPAFEREVWGDLASPVLDDQVEALHALASERTELDLERVAIRGWSFGGYLAALAVLRRPDVFHVAIAGAPVTDWLLYDTHYTERYLGHPDTYPEHYEQTRLRPDPEGLERALLLIHGLADDNVVAAHTLVLSQALLEAGSPHEVLPLSGVTHMTPQEKVAENLLLHQLDFLERSLPHP